MSRRRIAAAVGACAAGIVVALGGLVTVSSRRDAAAPVRTCADGRFQCGRTHTVRGTTVDAPRRDFSTDDYARLYCWPPTADRDAAGEWAYEIDLADAPSADVSLTSGPVDLELVAIAGACPDGWVGRPDACRETWPHRRHVTIAASVARTWLVVVDGVDDREGPFELTVTCSP